MSIKDTCIELGDKIQGELVKIRTEQRLLGEDLTHRINGVDNRVKDLARTMDAGFARVDERLTGLEGRMNSMEGRMESMDGRMESMEGRMESMQEGQKTMQATQTEMLHILVGIQSKLDAA
ncbi:hypothetical protein ABGB14_06600 [Nonomuraea sp. B10E15]|uniref:hypothetical protein n=1 Tax=Nonomuraea sp. B10E15 TaxID=3153560 RepID=UPI00325DD7B2